MDNTLGASVAIKLSKMLRQLPDASNSHVSSNATRRVIVLKQIVAAIAKDLLDTEVRVYTRARMFNELWLLAEVEAYTDAAGHLYRLPTGDKSDEERKIRKLIDRIICDNRAK
jgi:hypothetical protein